MIIADNLFIQNQILASTVILETLPQLRTLKDRILKLNKECATCGGKASRQAELDVVWNDVREVLANATAEQRELIRERAGNGQPIRVSYRFGRGESTQIRAVTI